jgi:transposase InsO family protein
MTDAPVALDLLRRQVAALLSQIDTATLPAPDKLHGPRDKHPGREWNPAKGWRTFTVETGEGAGLVFMDHVCDDITYRWGEPGDWEALRIEDARRIGLALLAAAHRAEELFVGVSRLDVFRRPDDTAGAPPVDGPTAVVRQMKPRGSA